MNHLTFAFWIWIFSANFCASVKLPSTVTKCQRKQNDFEQCLIAATENVLALLDKSIPELGLPSFEPLKLLGSKYPPGRVIRFVQEYEYMNFKGLRGAKLSRFSLDLEEGVLEVDGVFPVLSFDAKYHFKGKLRMNPIDIKGIVTSTLENFSFNFRALLEEYQKDGQKHIKIVTSATQFDEEKMICKFESDDKKNAPVAALLSKYFIENLRNVSGDIAANYDRVWDSIFFDSFNSVFDKVPLPYLFDD